MLSRMTTETADSDNDGVGDNAALFQMIPETTDTDGDGVGDNADWAPNNPDGRQIAMAMALG